MSVLTIAITAAVTSLVSGLVGALVATIIGAAKDKARDASEGDKALRDGMRCLLWRELKSIHAESVEDGGMTIEERRHLEGVYSAYHGIGGNGTGTRLYEESMELPVID